jgi:hypothetical protein
VADESEVTDMEEDGRHQERRREEAERRREAEKKRREQIRREKMENDARAFAAEQDRAIKDLISSARALTMDIEDFLMAVEELLVTGESRKRGSEMLATASKTILSLHMVPGVNLDPLILSLRQAKVRLSKRLAESDAATSAAASPPRPSYFWGCRSGSTRIF